jgi:hypothetical protein
VCEDGASLSIGTLGCSAIGDPTCAGLPDGENCVRLEHGGGVIVAVYTCPDAVLLPTDLCGTDVGRPNFWNCCALPGCK